MKKEQYIQAVLFDVDGTLYPNYKMYIISVIFFILHPCLAKGFQRIRKKIRDVENIENFQQKQAQLLAEDMRISIKKAEFLLEKYIYGQFVTMFKWIKPYKVLKELLSEFKQSGLKLGIISDFPVNRKLSYLGFDEYWDIVLSADEYGFLKPKKETFIKASEELNIPVEKIIYIGNHYLYDIIGAGNAGMITAHFSRKKKSGSIADFTFSDYSALKDFIMKYRI